MTFTRVFLYILLALFLYKIVFDVLLPIIKVSWRVRRQIKEFQRQHQQQQGPVQNNASAAQPSAADTSTASKPKSGDYIDFEEVKE